MKIKIKDYMLLFLAVLPVILTAYVIRIMPENVLFSFGLFDTAKWKSKYELFCYPIFILFLPVFFIV